MTTTITLFQLDDRPRWAELWTGYLTFYNTALPPEQYEHTWAGLMDGRLHGRGARDAHGRLVGIAHFMFQDSAWTRKPVVYLQDLFVDPTLRGGGIGRQLIEAVGDAARAAGAPRMWWFTHNQNATARRLYDQVATLSEHVRYDYPLD
jgi:GNAT superfamily N-acetyltransferase